MPCAGVMIPIASRIYQLAQWKVGILHKYDFGKPDNPGNFHDPGLWPSHNTWTLMISILVYFLEIFVWKFWNTPIVKQSNRKRVKENRWKRNSKRWYIESTPCFLQLDYVKIMINKYKVTYLLICKRHIGWRLLVYNSCCVLCPESSRPESV